MKFVRSRAFAVVGLMVLVFFGYLLVKEVQKKYEINHEISDLQKQVNQLGDRNKELNDLISYFGTDAYKELQAREKLNLQKEGEVVVALPPDQSQLGYSPDAASDQAKQVKQSNPQLWWNYFFAARTN